MNNKLENAGAVHIFDMSLGYDLTFASAKSVIYSSERKSRFGKRILWKSQNLLVSAPSYSGPNVSPSFSNE